ncbi:MAG: hypothetical protein LBO80_02495 [Treponema sp.]|jgi:uncharacterized protein with ACT and thioredoxin-like domain|nr:hypothetical protein [Treponema sp.]
MGQRKLFIVMVRAELEDSIEGLEELSVICKHRLNSGEITNYVYNENEALLHQEISGLKKLLPIVDTVKTEDYQDVHDLAQKLEALLTARVEKLQGPQAVSGIVSRKIRKILNYILEWPE